MFFKRKKPAQLQRKRTPAMPSSRQRTVFSYHASRATDEQRSPVAKRNMWQTLNAANNPKAPKTPLFSLRRFRKLPMVLAVLAATIFVINALILTNKPEIITVADANDRRIFLRDTATYEQTTHDILAGSVFNTNKITINAHKIEEKLQAAFPELEHVSVVLPAFGHRPLIYLQPSRPAMLVKVPEGIFVLDAAGHAVMNAARNERVEKLELPLVEDQSGLSVTLGHVLLPSDNITFITEVAGQLRAKNIVITNMVLPKGSGELVVNVKDVPYAIKFNLRGDARAAVGTYLAVRQHLEREGKTPSMYIDVRVDNKAYYQ